VDETVTVKFMDDNKTNELEKRLLSYTTLAAFQFKDTWRWVRWTHNEPNHHKAIPLKGEELGANAWDFGQAEHHETSRFPVSR
jgi:hypothetical protein